ncbi:MAG: hypothetical protein FJZ56_02100 [Chlamydiae bacterium]|nr:hypothetical protein [Chlamydiota bacterium]
MKMMFRTITFIALTASLIAAPGSPAIRPSEEAGDLSDIAPRSSLLPQRNPEPLPQESEKTLEDEIIESDDQQMQEPFEEIDENEQSPLVGVRFGNSSSFVTFVVTLVFCAVGVWAANTNKGKDVT